MNIAPLLMSIQEARKERTDLLLKLKEMRSIESQVETINQFISATELMIQTFPQQGEPIVEDGLRRVTVPRVLDIPVPEHRLWKMIQMVMQIEKRPLTAGEVLDLLGKHHVVVQGEHRRESVRNAMVRQDDVFERVDRGLFAIRDWPTELKTSRNDAAFTEDESRDELGFMN